jgi:hypothetical protein
VDVADVFLRGVGAYVSRGSPLWGIAIYTVLMIGSAITLYCFSLQVAPVLLKGTSQTREDLAGPAEWFAVGCRLLGLWFLGRNASQLPITLSFLHHNVTSSYEITFLHLLSELLAICLGVFLLTWKQRGVVASIITERDSE